MLAIRDDARPHTDEIRITRPKNGRYFGADEWTQQIELGVRKKQAPGFFKTGVFCQTLISMLASADTSSHGAYPTDDQVEEGTRRVWFAVLVGVLRNSEQGLLPQQDS